MRSTEVNGITIRLAEEGMTGVAVGVVVARGCQPGPATAELEAALDDAIARAKTLSGEETVTRPVRDLLRFGVYKPTGRGKPASEYLLKAARTDAFPRIQGLVDLNNLVSLETLLPISLIDLERAEVKDFTVRRGRAGEAYVFNSVGQRIELQDLLLVARGSADAPCANPVKDSMDTKLGEAPSDVMAVIYSPGALADRLEQAGRRFAEGFRAWGGAASVEVAYLP